MGKFSVFTEVHFLDGVLGEIAKMLLLNSYTIEGYGLMQGKAGVAVTLFELSKYLNSEFIENHAFKLF